VLFSEPKIPQLSSRTRRYGRGWRFQCSSASRKFLNSPRGLVGGARAYLSVLFSEPKIPQPSRDCSQTRCASLSVLFSEPKIPQPGAPSSVSQGIELSVLFSEPKIPQPCS